jgi:hypothetical protein
MAEVNKLKKHVKRSRKIALKPSLKSRRVAISQDPSKSTSKRVYSEIVEKFIHKFSIKNCRHIENLWSRIPVGDSQKLSMIDLTIPMIEITEELKTKLLNYDCSENLAKMKLLGQINTKGDCKIKFSDLVDSGAYKKQLNLEQKKINEHIWRFGFEDLRGNFEQEHIQNIDKLTQKELLEMWVDHRREMPLIKHWDYEEENRLRTISDSGQDFKTDLQLFTEFIRVFPIIKRKETELEVKWVYLIPNIEFIIWPIKLIPFSSWKLLSALESKSGQENYDFYDATHKSGFLSVDGRGKLVPYMVKDIKQNPISGIWIYNDFTQEEMKGKNVINKIVQKAWLNYQVLTHLLRFILSLKRLNNHIETASKSCSSFLLWIFFKSSETKPLLWEFKINEILNSMKKRRKSNTVEKKLRDLSNKWVIFSPEQVFSNVIMTNPVSSDYKIFNYFSKSFAAYWRQVHKTNNRKRSVSTVKRSISTSHIYDNSENMHPNT